MKKIVLLMATALIAVPNICHAKTASYGVTHIQNQKIAEQSFYGETELTNVVADRIQIYGSLQATDLQASQISVNGALKASKIMADNLEVYGPFVVDVAQIESMNIAGPVNMKNGMVKQTTSISGPLKVLDSKFDGTVEVMGPVYAEKVIFEAPLTFYGNNSAFDQVIADKIIVKKGDSWNKEPQIVTLKASRVKEIIFESGKGQVVSIDSSVDKLTGGTITNQG